MRFTAPSVLAALALAVLMTGSARAADDVEIPGAPRLLPVDTMAYLRLDNADQFREDMANSSIGKMLSDPKLRPFVGEFMVMASDLFQIIGDQLGVTLDEVLAIPSGQVAVALMPGNFSDREKELVEQEYGDDESDEAISKRLQAKRAQQNSFAGLFLLDAGDNVGTLMDLLETGEAAILSSGFVRRTTEIDGTTLVHLLPPRPGTPEIEYFEKDGVVIVGIGHKTAENALNQWLGNSDDETMADDIDFASIMSRCVGAEETRPQITFFVDPYHIAERIIKRTGAALVWPIVENIGVAKIRGLGGSMFTGGETFESITHFHILIDPPRDGIFGVLRPENVDTMPPKWVPDDISSYLTLKWDLLQTYENVGKILEKFQGEGALERLVDQNVKNATGISLREDVFENLTGRYVLSTWLEPPVRINSQTQCHALEVKDAAALKALLERLRQRFPQYITIDTISGATVYSAPVPNQMPGGLRAPQYGMTVIGNWAVLTDSRRFMERCVRANRDELPRLLNELDYELIASELGGKLDGEKPFMLAFARSADSFRQLYELVKSPDTKNLLRQVGQENPVVQRVLKLLEGNELPPFEEFEKYFAPSGSFAYDEPGGMHMASFTLRAEE